MRLLCILLTACLLSGCSYASGTIDPSGAMHFTYWRPWLEKREMELSYNPETKEIHIMVDTVARPIPMADLGALIGAAIKGAMK